MTPSPTIESTPEMAAGIYARMASALSTVRVHRTEPLTLADKLLLGHLDDPQGDTPRPGHGYMLLRPDRVVFQDVLGQSGMLQFMQTRRSRVAVPTSIHCDHLIQARTRGDVDLRESLAENNEVYDFLRTAASKFGVGFWEPGAGIIHTVVLENYAFPGELIIGTDSHTPNAGGLSACAIGVGGADAVEVIAGLPWEVFYPKRIAVYLSGALNGWTAPKDVILSVAGRLGVSGGTNAIIEYIGPGARTLSATGKATITNMGAELGATTSVFPADQHIVDYLRATRRGGIADLVERHLPLLVPDAEAEAEPRRYYDQVLEVNLSTLEPHVVGPHSPDRARPLSQFAAEVRASGGAFVDEISAALIGSCTNSSYEDMSRAADVAAQGAAQGLKAQANLFVTPGSEQIRATLERDGQLRILERIGARVLANACGPCIGQWRREGGSATAANSIVTSYNRNFPMRNDGRAATMNFIASPEIVTALALAGRLSFNPMTDTLIGAQGPFHLQPPARATTIPLSGFSTARVPYTAPAADGTTIELKVREGSERLQLLAPWPAWDGADFADLPVLIKTRGKTTTDDISPAGPWLKFRGHLDRFSDNLFLGATNAFTDETGRGRNVFTQESSQRFAQIARDYRARGSRWVAIGDANYGEGSSREHAALSPRLLGCAAVVARSFARIHETNLKKQGILALTFVESGDYDSIAEADRIDIIGLATLEPGKPVAAQVHHAGGATESITLKHSYSQSQLAWFYAGSALNTLKPSMPSP
jgi:aconitate hydratase